MDQQDFRSAFLGLLELLCADRNTSFVVQVPTEPDALSVDMTLGDADVRLTHSHSAAPDMHLEFHFGVLPQTRETLLRLLELNTLLMRQGEDVFGLDSETGSLIRHCIGPLASLNASALVEQMLAIGAEASVWIDASSPEAESASVIEMHESNPFDSSCEGKVGIYGRIASPIIWG